MQSPRPGSIRLSPHHSCSPRRCFTKSSLGLHDLCNLGQLILQSAIGVLVLVLCFVERKQFSMQIVSKLGSSFSLVPFIIVVASCTILAMVASLPIAQLLFFHILLIKKFDVIPSEAGSLHNSATKRKEDEARKKKGGAVKISPWALARLNAEEVSRVAAEAQKKSKVLVPIRKDDYLRGHKKDASNANSMFQN